MIETIIFLHDVCGLLLFQRVNRMRNDFFNLQDKFTDSDVTIGILLFYIILLLICIGVDMFMKQQKVWYVKCETCPKKLPVFTKPDGTPEFCPTCKKKAVENILNGVGWKISER